MGNNKLWVTWDDHVSINNRNMNLEEIRWWNNIKS